jgi:hypothetical protein
MVKLSVYLYFLKCISDIISQNYWDFGLFPSSGILVSRRWTKSKNPVILCVTHHRQNPLESTDINCSSLMIKVIYKIHSVSLMTNQVHTSYYCTHVFQFCNYFNYFSVIVTLFTLSHILILWNADTPILTFI